MPKAYLIDIEGTTTPIDFVTKTLFPYARKAVPGFIERSLADLESRLALVGDCCLLAEEHAKETHAPAWPDKPDPTTAVPYVQWLIDQDRKSTGLKSLQGRIWKEGYESGEIKGEVYPDVWPAVRRWKADGAKVAIFSSGSVLAQKLIFGHLPEGDMTPLIDAYFDTTTGSKREAESYRRIAEELGVAASDVLFLSDISAEVDAARKGGLQALQVARPGTAATDETAIADFSSL